jgi:hypothetical protein
MYVHTYELCNTCDIEVFALQVVSVVVDEARRCLMLRMTSDDMCAVPSQRDYHAMAC